jgi:hypothetical protein
MNTATKDDTQIYCNDWGRPRLATMHGTPGPTRCRLSAPRDTDASPMTRRGHGRSSQPWNGRKTDTCADDLAPLVEAQRDPRPSSDSRSRQKVLRTIEIWPVSFCGIEYNPRLIPLGPARDVSPIRTWVTKTRFGASAMHGRAQ